MKCSGTVVLSVEFNIEFPDDLGDSIVELDNVLQAAEIEHMRADTVVKQRKQALGNLQEVVREKVMGPIMEAIHPVSAINRVIEIEMFGVTLSGVHEFTHEVVI